MTNHTPSVPSMNRPGLWDLFRGHLLLFDAHSLPVWTKQQIIRVVLCALVLELGVRFMLTRALLHGTPTVHPNQLVLVLLLIGALLLMHELIRIPLEFANVRPWGAWHVSQRAYLLETALVASFVFGWVHISALRDALRSEDLLRILSFAFLPNLLWGVYQEWVYRGWLQRVLVQHWGKYAGIMASNLTFTFGPLHAYHWFTLKSTLSQQINMFFAIFLVGLFFAIVFQRSQNLLIVGVFHGIGNAFMQGLPRVE